MKISPSVLRTRIERISNKLENGFTLECSGHTKSFDGDKPSYMSVVLNYNGAWLTSFRIPTGQVDSRPRGNFLYGETWKGLKAVLLDSVVRRIEQELEFINRPLFDITSYRSQGYTFHRCEDEVNHDTLECRGGVSYNHYGDEVGDKDLLDAAAQACKELASRYPDCIVYSSYAEKGWVTIRIRAKK